MENLIPSLSMMIMIVGWMGVKMRALVFQLETLETGGARTTLDHIRMQIERADEMRWDEADLSKYRFLKIILKLISKNLNHFDRF